MNHEQIIFQTQQWIQNVVIACNFCPFASKVIKEKTAHYEVAENETIEILLQTLQLEFERLDQNNLIETSFLILPNAFPVFDDYLAFVDEAEELLENNQYEGIYQLASFHPHYCFAGENPTDASHFTNRSPYAMLHILREESVEKALKNYPNSHEIPIRNIAFAKEKGLQYMKMLRDNCF